MQPKIYIASFLAFIIISASLLSEYFFLKESETIWVNNIQDRILKQEEKADAQLAKFSSVAIYYNVKDENITYLGFKEGTLIFWTNELNAGHQLYEKIKSSDEIVKLGNTYYEKRSRHEDGIEYFALINIYDDYSYKSEYIQNKYSSFLKISEANTDKISFNFHNEYQGYKIQNKENIQLFTINFAKDYQENNLVYILIISYIIFIFLIFYIYNNLTKHASTINEQLKYLFAFSLFIIIIRILVTWIRFPYSIFQLQLFNVYIDYSFFKIRAGYLVFDILCISEIISITLVNLKLSYNNNNHHKYILAPVLLIFIFIYSDVFNLASELIVDNIDTRINMGNFASTYWIPLLAFFLICIIGQLLLVLIFTYSSIFYRLLKAKHNIIIITATAGLFILYTYITGTSTNHFSHILIYIIITIVVLAHYRFSNKSLRYFYVVSLLLLSIYTVIITQNCEMHKEQKMRKKFAQELIEERDYAFESKLPSIDATISQSKYLELLIQEGRYLEIAQLLNNDLLNISGYNYNLQVTFSSTEREDPNAVELQRIINRYGTNIKGTRFYSISIFDGMTSYIGRIDWGEHQLYLRFSANNDDNKRGYVQVLSRYQEPSKSKYYNYSYAKYSQGELTSNKGMFVYNKKLALLTTNNKDEYFTKDGYSHMQFPLEDNNVLIVSLPIGVNRSYYFNIFYTFFIYILLSSYDIFFLGIGRNKDHHKSSLRNQIKSSTIALIFGLLALLVALTIAINIDTLERNKHIKSQELTTFARNQLDLTLNITKGSVNDLADAMIHLGNSLSVDINIYNEQGILIASTYPNIFRQALDGVIINPRALYSIKNLGESSYTEDEYIGSLSYASNYMPLHLNDGKMYIVNIPYFDLYNDLLYSISFIIVTTVNISLLVMMLAFLFSGIIANRVVQPLQMINQKLKLTHIGNKNEKINYNKKNEIGELVQEYNNMVDKLENSIAQLAHSERETAWQEMARQIAHEIKNPLTPMKLNIQFMQRAIEQEDAESFKERFKEYSKMLIDQINDMATTASTFSDFAKISIANKEPINIDELATNCKKLFENSIEQINCTANSGAYVFADKEQLRRVFINILKNSEQSIPQGRTGRIDIYVRMLQDMIEIVIRDNGCGIPEDIRKKIFTPNFTTKSSGTGLGLAISHKIIEDINGSISFKSEIDEGTEFIIKLHPYTM